MGRSRARWAWGGGLAASLGLAAVVAWIAPAAPTGPRAAAKAPGKLHAAARPSGAGHRAATARAHAGAVSKAHNAVSTAHPAASSAQMATALLKKSRWALMHVPFQGRELTVTFADGRTESAIARRVHFDSHERSEYLAPKSLKGQIYLSDGRSTRIYNPVRRRVVVYPREERADLNLPLLLKNYVVTLDPKPHTIADRPCRVVRIEPREPGKPSRVLCLDSATALELKHERFHADGTPATLTQFTDIKIGAPIDPRLFTLDLPKDVRQVHPIVRRGASGPRPHLASNLSAGYQLQSCSDAPGGSGWHCLYSDGADVISVFILRESSRRKLPRGIAVRIGPYTGVMQRRSHHWIVTWTAGRNRLALIGDLSRERVLELARSVASG